MRKEPAEVTLSSQTGVVVPFARRTSAEIRLSMRDRMEVSCWQEQARGFGYDRLVIHERGPTDPPDVNDFLCVYRRGEAWSRWALARRGAAVLAWCSVSGTDAGVFSSVADALHTLLPGAPPPPQSGNVIAAFG